ncbi:MAG: hypothetical protein FWH01_15765 [Oscillospiraceae bacterium]|nr:hypothetical protein [Oscillospiraceae bacterium]
MKQPWRRGHFALCLSCLLALLCGACDGGIDYDTIYITDELYSAYPGALADACPQFTIDTVGGDPYYYLEAGLAVEAFDAQALPALGAGMASHWYPQHLATVVIAVDRDITDVAVNGWSDLIATQEGVGLEYSQINMRMLMSAMAYGLEWSPGAQGGGSAGEPGGGLADEPGGGSAGEPGGGSLRMSSGTYTLDSAVALLAALHKDSRLVQSLVGPPILICYDYQAAALKKSGRNIEIVIPAEGTLSFEKGLLSKTELPNMVDAAQAVQAEQASQTEQATQVEQAAQAEQASQTEQVAQAFIDAGLRVPDGRCDAAIYPGADAYAAAGRPVDFERLNAITQDAVRFFRRDVIKARLYSSADSREHQLFVLIYIVLIAIWTASIAYRSTQKGVRRAALWAGIGLFGWIAVRLIKYQVPDDSHVSRYLWFSYYIFQLSLPVVLCWLAWAIDRRGAGSKPPVWLRGISAINATLIALVMTNDIHNLVFIIDLSKPDWAFDYGYDFMFYIVLAFNFAPLAIAVAMMLWKGRHGLRKPGLVLITVLFALLAAYAYGYVMRVPIAWDSDVTMVYGLFALLFMEVAVQAGMIPVNTNYAALFTNSPLGMRITDGMGRIVWSSRASARYSREMFLKSVAAAPAPARQDEDTLLYAAALTGGYVLWQEDISKINRLHREIGESVGRLEAANAVLVEEEKIRRTIDAESARAQLMTQLEVEISGHTAKLSAMIEQLDGMQDRRRAAAEIMLLLCYVKRRCNLFFLEREGRRLLLHNLGAYLDEMAEIALYADVKIIVTQGAEGSGMPVRRATLLYDMFYNVINWAAQLGGTSLLAHVSAEAGSYVLRMLHSEGAGAFRMDNNLEAAIASAGGTYAIKELDDDAVGLSLSFPEADDDVVAYSLSFPKADDDVAAYNLSFPEADDDMTAYSLSFPEADGDAVGSRFLFPDAEGGGVDK